MASVLEQLAEWYLHRRGRHVLPRTFFGLAVGYCYVRYDEAHNTFEVMPIHPQSMNTIIALNHSVVTTMPINEDHYRA